MENSLSVLLCILAAAALVAAGALIRKYRRTKSGQVTEEDLKTLVSEGQEHGVLETSEAEMITNIFEFNEKNAGDIMTHRRNVIALDAHMHVKDAADFVLMESSNSRFPVYHEDLDDVIGTVHMRDLLIHARNPRETEMKIATVPGLLREAHFIPETREIGSLFREMQSQKIHLAVVIDEYGQTAGIVTMEDILEEIVGNILDEYDEDEQFITQGADGTFVMSGMTPLEDVQETLGIEIPEEDLDDFDTLNGLLISLLSRIPGEEERPQIEYQGCTFSVTEVEDKMIRLVTVTRPEPQEEPQEQRESLLETLKERHEIQKEK